MKVGDKVKVVDLILKTRNDQIAEIVDIYKGKFRVKFGDKKSYWYQKHELILL